MGIEKYQPSPEEMKDAEDMLTQEQKVQSEAHEEGYNLGKEKGKTVVYAGAIQSLEKTKTLDVIKENLVFEVGNQVKLSYAKLIKRLCEENKVKFSISEVPGMMSSTFNVGLEGAKENVNVVLKGLAEVGKTHNKSLDNILNIFKPPR